MIKTMALSVAAASFASGFDEWFIPEKIRALGITQRSKHMSRLLRVSERREGREDVCVSHSKL